MSNIKKFTQFVNESMPNDMVFSGSDGDILYPDAKDDMAEMEPLAKYAFVEIQKEYNQLADIEYDMYPFGMHYGYVHFGYTITGLFPKLDLPKKLMRLYANYDDRGNVSYYKIEMYFYHHADQNPSDVQTYKKIFTKRDIDNMIEGAAENLKDAKAMSPW